MPIVPVPGACATCDAGGGGGPLASEHAEDSPHVSGDIGSFSLAVRNDAHAVFTSLDGDYSPFSVDSSGALNVADNGSSLTVDGTVALDAPTLAALEIITALQGTSPWVVGDGGGSLTVDGTVATNAERAEDSAHTSGNIGNFILGVRNDAAAVLTSADLDYSPIATDSAGRVLTVAPAAVTLNAQHRLVTDAAAAWTPGADVTGTLTSVTFTVLSGTATVLDSNSTSASLPVGFSGTWSVEDRETLTGPVSIDAIGGDTYVSWVQR